MSPSTLANRLSRTGFGQRPTTRPAGYRDPRVGLAERARPARVSSIRPVQLVAVACAAALVGAFPMGCGHPAADTAAPDRVLLLGVDGLSWEYADAMIAKGELPNLQRVLQGGVRATAEAPHPLDSPGLWATILTGKEPTKHGMTGVLTRLPNGLLAPVPSNVRRTRSLWQMLSEQHVLIAASGMPGSWPAEIVNGFLATNAITTTRWFATAECTFQRDEGQMATYPAVLEREIEPLIRPPDGIPRADVARFFTLTEEDYRAVYDEPLGSILQHQNPLKEFAITWQADNTHLDVAHYLLQTYRPRVLGTSIELLAAVQPFWWLFAHPETFPVNADGIRRFGHAVDESYRFVDEQLGKLLQQMTPHSTLLVVGGYGFGTGRRPASDGSGSIPFPESTPQAALVLYGQGIRRGARLEHAELVDVTPTILAMLDCPVAADMDGSVLRDAFTPAFLAAHPVESIPTYDTASRLARYPGPLTFFGEQATPADSSATAGSR